MTRIERLEKENKRLREALGLFALALNSHDGREHLDQHWSFGYWSGVDPGLVFVGGNPDEPAIQNTRFRAVMRYEPEHLKKVLRAAKEAK